MHRSRGRAAKESRRSYWLDGLLPGVCNVFIKASKCTVFKHVYGSRFAAIFVVFFVCFFGGGFWKLRTACCKSSFRTSLHQTSLKKKKKKNAVPKQFSPQEGNQYQREETQAGDKQRFIISKA